MSEDVAIRRVIGWSWLVICVSAACKAALIVSPIIARELSKNTDVELFTILVCGVLPVGLVVGVYYGLLYGGLFLLCKVLHW